ncbi:MAG: hypothetical protein HN729_11015 [Candidatus Marinimicrobia bacterium]|nr:hypothetical protein [Candidatus Neomarinimicrobiota bacterium]MBT3634292.1 hypothetical protein [Candidatus Neomarinimicrobiota bacterium]MBT3682909.1 hypothetical protein [Candidatus Neomarinimicrobiota bacterium]MBT3760101.1 hypothetical protein [Candidatus Neomarinimicrobiota bacterium]MBT3896132.1 hypothetical protein [Candidatus Neomarinimicrobiota bacterium]
MNPWDLNVNLQDVVMDFLYLSSFIIAGTILRRYVKFFQSYLVPNNFIAGVLALIVGTQCLGWVDLHVDRLIIYVYHLLALTFIALGLRQSKSLRGRGPVSKSLASLTVYVFQAVSGLLVALLLFYTFMPDLFVGIGLVVPLGFGMGPGLAATLAGSWEKHGFTGGAQVGLTFATIGYLYAFFLGIAMVKWGIKRNKAVFIKSIDHISRETRIGIQKRGYFTSAGKLPQSTEAIEPLAFHMAAIGFVYLLTYLVVKGITDFLISNGLSEFVPTIWSFHFVVGLLLSLAVRKILDKTDKAYLIDNGLMTRGMGLFLDYLVVGAIAGISFTIVGEYWLPILIMTLIAGPGTLLITYYACYHAFSDYHFERFITLFGEMTGTVNSALVLLRIVDPEFKSPVAEDTVVGGGISLFLGFPLLYALNIPLVHYHNSISGYWVTLGIIVFYWLILLIFWLKTGYLNLKAEENTSVNQTNSV